MDASECLFSNEGFQLNQKTHVFCFCCSTFIVSQGICISPLLYDAYNSTNKGDDTQTGKTGKIVKSNSRQGKHREFENFRMILKSNSHLHSRAAGRDS